MGYVVGEIGKEGSVGVVCYKDLKSKSVILNCYQGKWEINVPRAPQVRSRPYSADPPQRRVRAHVFLSPTALYGPAGRSQSPGQHAKGGGPIAQSNQNDIRSRGNGRPEGGIPTTDCVPRDADLGFRRIGACR